MLNAVALQMSCLAASHQQAPAAGTQSDKDALNGAIGKAVRLGAGRCG